MRKKFTKLTAALALLAFLAIPMGMRGQTQYTLTISASDFNTTSYAANNNEKTSNAVEINGSGTYEVNWTSYQVMKNGNNMQWQKNKGYIYNSTDLGTINSVTVNSSAGTFTTYYGTTEHPTSGTTVGNGFFTTAVGNATGTTSSVVITFTIAGGTTPTCVTPTFSPAAGTYTQAQNVTISCTTDNATIYYTTDGNDPSTSSSVYSAPLVISETTTVKAMAAADGYNNSSVASATYTITTPSTIAAVRAQGTGSVFTQGIVTSCVGTTGYIQDATAAICVYGTSLTVGDEITVSGTLSTYNGLLEITNPVVNVVSSGNTVNPELMTIAEINASTNQGWYIRIEEATVTNISGSGNSQNTTIAQGNNTVVVRGNLGTTIAVNDIISLNGNIGAYNGVQIANPQNVEVQQNLEPSVTVTPATINAPYQGAEGTLALTYENIEEFISFDYYFCDAEGNQLQEGPDWIDAEIQEEDDTYSLYYIIDANDGAARTAYIKVYTFDDNEEEVYAIVTVNQAEYVVDYATLPFEWDTFGNTPAGITNSGVSTGSNNAYLKFDTSGDYIVLKINERPGTLTFDIKGNPGSNGWAGTFKVQTSADGVSYTDFATYEELPTTDYQEESFANLDENVRYIKWIYETKTSGNVALDNISLAAYEVPGPAITVDPTTITATAEETEGTLDVTYTEIETDLGINIYWFESDGTTDATEPDWILVEVNSELNVDYLIEANDGEARTAYFKLYGLDEEANSVYSELVTITQAAAPQQYTLTVEPFENLELITFVNDDMVMEADGEVQVNEDAHIMLSIVADEGYVMETLMVNGVNHVNDIAADFTYEFDMPAENVTISATAVEQVAPVGGDYVRVTSLDQLTDGSIVVIAARYDEEHTNGYYAMQNYLTSGKSTGVQFTSQTSGNDEILPASIVNAENDYYWTVNVTEDGYTFTNAEGQLIGYGTSGTNFVMGGTKTEWTIERSTSDQTSLVGEYTGFVIKNKTTNTRAFAFNGSVFGAYATTNMNGSSYNFFLDFFVQSEVETETYPLEITGYGDITNSGNYYLIASPIGDVDPEEVENMLSNNYDLYYFNQAAEDAEWVNYKAHPDDDNFLKRGKGFLYANSEDVTLIFTGTAYSGDGIVTLTKTDGADWEGWNLVGNPFAEIVYIADGRDFYTMDEQGANIITATSNSIQSMEGVFVVAESDGEEIVFTTQAPANPGEKLVLNLSNGRNVIDRTIIRFGEGRQLPKFQLFENSTKVYIPMDGQDYAVVRSEEVGEMPVNFKAEENGTYTLTFDSENVEFAYLHLIDNLTDTDVDVLATPSYSFEANTVDNANRFKLVYATGILSVSENFAFFNNGNFVINNEGKATLQVIDITGRVLSNETIDGSANVDLNAAPGVYMIRLANGDNVKVQKVVVR